MEKLISKECRRFIKKKRETRTRRNAAPEIRKPVYVSRRISILKRYKLGADFSAMMSLDHSILKLEPFGQRLNRPFASKVV